MSDVCDHLLIKIPGFDEVFPNLGHRDRMHAAMIFLHRQLITLLIELKIPAKDKVTMDDRLVLMSTSGCFRDVATRRSYRTQKTLFSEANMTAQDRVCVMFFIPHVLGHEALVLPPVLRRPVLDAVAVAQQMLIALTSKRAYTKTELHTIFDAG